MSDQIADMFSRLRNGYTARQEEVKMPWSKMKEALARILVKNHYLEKMTTKKSQVGKQKDLVLKLKYQNREPALTTIVRLSKPGCRLYIQGKKIKPVKSGLGINLISTPAGVMTGKEARTKKLGGELIGQVW